MPSVQSITMSAEEQAAMAAALHGATPGTVITPVLMGVIIDCILLGVLSSQLINWFTYSRKGDSWAIQISVFFTSFIGLGVSLLSICWVMYLFGFKYGQWTPWNDNRWLSWYPLMDAGMVIVVQCFYAERAYQIAGRAKSVIVLVLLPLALSLIGALGVVVSGMLKNDIDPRYANFLWMWAVGTFVADFVVTAVVLYGLLRQRTDWEQTDTIVKRLIRIACESQLPPTVVALVLLIDYAVQGATYYGVFFEMIQGKIYVIGMIYVLNSRYFLRRELDEGVLSFTQRPGTHTMNARARVLGPATIHVQTETYVESHQLNPAFVQPRLQPKFREPSESGDTIGTISNEESTNQSQVGLNSSYMERVNAVKKKGEFSLVSFAAMS